MNQPKKCTSKEKPSRSRRLQKYEVAYEICMKKLHQNSPKKSPQRAKSPRKKPNKSPRKKKESSKKSLPRKKSLNPYQTFVQEESQQSKYRGIDAKTRLKLIGQAWHNNKKETKP